MTDKVKLSLQVEPELRRRIKLSATARDESLREWVYRAILRELDHEEEEQEYYPGKGTKPVGLDDAPRPKSGRAVAEAVIEDRR